MKSCDGCKYRSLWGSDYPCNVCSDGCYYKTVAHESVNHPEHYQGKYECVDEMIELFGVEAVKAFCRCNVYKYHFRADRKNGEEDLAKANWYMEKLMELNGHESTSTK